MNVSYWPDYVSGCFLTQISLMHPLAHYIVISSAFTVYISAIFSFQLSDIFYWAGLYLGKSHQMWISLTVFSAEIAPTNLKSEVIWHWFSSTRDWKTISPEHTKNTFKRLFESMKFVICRNCGYLGKWTQK